MAVDRRAVLRRHCAAGALALIGWIALHVGLLVFLHPFRRD